MKLGINLQVGSNVQEAFRELVSSVPYELKKIQGIAELDPFILSEKYFEAGNVADASIDPNANMGVKSPVSYQSEIFKPQLKYNSYYELWKRLLEDYSIEVANDCITSVLDGSIYYHDIVKNNMPYCFAFDTSFLMTQGRPYGWLPSNPPKRSTSFMAQVIETTMDMSQNHAGAIGVANLLVSLAYYTKKERKEIHESLKTSLSEMDSPTYLKVYKVVDILAKGLGYSGDILSNEYDKEILTSNVQITEEEAFVIADYIYDKHIQNILQNFVHIMHNTFRIGGDSPFTNISLFDRETFRAVFDTPIYPDFTFVRNNYEEVERVQKIFVEFFHKGSPTNGKNYRFPVVTANIRTDKEGKIQDEKFFNYITEKNRVRGAFNLHIGEKLASCCRLTSDLATLKDTIRVDTFGNGGLSIGSHRVVAINLHRMALISKYQKRGFEEVLNEYLEKAEKLLVAHKRILKGLVDSGFLNFFNIKWEDMSMFFSTIGFTGLIDAFSVKCGETLSEVLNSEKRIQEYKNFGMKVLTQMDSFSSEASKRNSKDLMAFNVEEIPAENASPKLAAADNYLYSNEPSYERRELLSNQMVPLYCNVNLITRLDITGYLMGVVSGGSILHININEQVTKTAYQDLVRLMIEKYKIVHFAVNVGTTVCERGHATPGIYKEECPICKGKPVDFNLRVVGFNTDWSSWSNERREEFKKRQIYTTVTNILSDKC